MKPNFSKSSDGLIPVIIQDAKTNIVLMLGYMNNEAFLKTETQRRVTFFSRSKNRLWTKGEESGHFLEVEEMLLDCDEDTILIKVKPKGVVCHTGKDTCFNEKNMPNFIAKLEEVIANRKANPNEKSYVSTLFGKGINKIAQKVGEEAVELIIEAKDNNADLFKSEAADLLFHYLILLSAKGFSLNDIIGVLERREGN
ncbi:bifunctional phosphoribosyl-AMP cyclohydrolase/phosphoribosyl-ATP diphosphatase HisIE [soil metagenome]